MSDFLGECGRRSQRSLIPTPITGTNAKFTEDIKLISDLADKIVADRKAHPTDKKDLLNTMLHYKDPQTRQELSDENITANLLTFLIAGHETTSGMLTFMIYHLLQHPETMRKLRTEIDTVLGGRPIQYDDLSKLPYLTAVMRESLRLSPSAPPRTVAAIADTTLGGGKYAIKAGVPIQIHTHVFQRDPAVWGEDAEEFRPERMLDGRFEALPPNAWQPFGFGLRACIGCPFAWQEVLLLVASIMQKFHLSMADPSYNHELQYLLTIKLEAFRIHASLRTDGPRIHASPSSSLMASNDYSGYNKTPAVSVARKAPIYVLYGSNTGTSESFAQRIATDALSYGFVPKIGTLDSATGHLPTDGPVIIATASFEGQPADNAATFVDWLLNLRGNELNGVKYAVFGSGNTEWVQTYQRIPTLCDEALEKHGGKRLLALGAGDASQGTFFKDFDEFEANLWKALSKEYSVIRNESDTGFEVKTLDAGTERSSYYLRQADAALGTVLETKVLTAPGAPTKIHLEFSLPEGQSYRTGDYLAILPYNPYRDIRRVLTHFGLSEEHRVVISSDGPTSLPVDKPVTVYEIFSGYVELSQPATCRNIETLVKAASAVSTRAALQKLKADYKTEILAKRVSVLDILERYPSDVKLSLGHFLRMLPPMRVRQDSISSSPLWNPKHVTLTIGVLQGASLSGDAKDFLGIGSTYLSKLRPGDRVQMTVRPSAAAFHPPEDPTVPMVMFCTGSGLAPMRGFIQERAIQKKSGRQVGRVLLFFGCCSPDTDYLYGDGEIAEWIKLGFLDVRTAFSRASSASKGCKYVQDRVWHDQDDIIKAYQENAKFFTCGSGEIVRGIKAKLIDILAYLTGFNHVTATAKLDSVLKGRYTTDIFD